MKQYGTRSEVFLSMARQTRGGLKRHDLLAYHRRIMSKKELARYRLQGRRNLSLWSYAVMCARKELGIRGFVVVRKGTPLYAYARLLYESDHFDSDYVCQVLDL